MADFNLGRVQGAGFFYASVNGATSVEKNLLTPTSNTIPALVGDCIVFKDGEVYKITGFTGTKINCTRVTSIKGPQGNPGPQPKLEDSLTSTSTTVALTANMGKKLNDDKASLSQVAQAGFIKNTQDAFNYNNLSNKPNLDLKQDKLTAGDSIKIENNVISVVDKSIYGVDNVGRSDPHNLPRTNDAIGKTFSDPASNNVITSDFDNCFPWSDIKEFTDKQGNVFIEIPKFYGKITANPNGTYKHQISQYKHKGFDTLFRDAQGNEFDYVRVGKYEASGTTAKAFSKSGQTCLVSLTIGQARAACMANGQGYHQYDFRIDAIIKELFMIEFATTDTQSIFRGYVDGNSAAIQTGHCDGILTGSNPSNTGGKSACVYRGIENPFGNIYKWCDGINFRKQEIWLCLDSSQYASDRFTAPYKNVGTRTSASGWLSGITPFVEYPLLGYASATSGSESTYYCDRTYCASGNRVLRVGGDWSYGSDAGLWVWNGNTGSSVTYSNIGSRLCYTPL